MEIIFLLILLLLIAGVCYAFYNRRSRELSFMNTELPQGFTYTAHTGCMDTRDNSLESIEIGAKYGAAIVEIDLQFYGDEPVLSHDEPIGGEIPLKNAFVKAQKIEGLKVNVDVKNTAYLGKVKEIAVETDMLDRIFFTGINESDVKPVQETCPGVPYYLNTDVLPARKHTPEYLKTLTEKVKKCGAVGINFNKDNSSKALVDAFHKAGLLVSIWTVNNKGDMLEILSYAPDNITTRNPKKMQEILEQ